MLIIILIVVFIVAGTIRYLFDKNEKKVPYTQPLEHHPLSSQVEVDCSQFKDSRGIPYRYSYKDVSLYALLDLDEYYSLPLGAKLELDIIDENLIFFGYNDKSVAIPPDGRIKSMIFDFFQRGDNVDCYVTGFDDERMDIYVFLGFPHPSCIVPMDLVHSSPKEMQENIRNTQAGETVTWTFDAERELYRVSSSAGIIGYVPKGSTTMFNNLKHLIVTFLGSSDSKSGALVANLEINYLDDFLASL